MSDDLESLRRRAQALSNQQDQSRQAAIEQARNAARADFQRWRQAIDFAIKEGHTFVFAHRYSSGGVSISSMPTIFGNMKMQYGWCIGQRELWERQDRYEAYGNELRKFLGGFPFRVWAHTSESDSGNTSECVNVNWGKDPVY